MKNNGYSNNNNNNNEDDDDNNNNNNAILDEKKLKYHLQPPTMKFSEQCFFVFNLEKFSILHVNLDVGGSSTGWFSTVLVVSSCATTGNFRNQLIANQNLLNLNLTNYMIG